MKQRKNKVQEELKYVLDTTPETVGEIVIFVCLLGTLLDGVQNVVCYIHIQPQPG